MKSPSAAPETSSGTLTFLFTDIEGSTRRWELHPEAMKRALRRHDEHLAAAVAAWNGVVIKTTGDGIMAVFPTAADGVNASLTAQRHLMAQPWGESRPLRVRMGLHAGAVRASDGDYHGPVVNRTARIMAVAHGGQVLLSAAVAALVADMLPDGTQLRDLGEHRLKDLQRTEHLFQLVHPDLESDFPPLASLNERPNNLPTQTSLFVGRAQELGEIRDKLAGAVRLLTLTGPGGTGKTRLALQAAADEIDRFEDGVFFVDVSTARDAESVVAAIVRSAGLDETEDRPRIDDLARQLRTRTVLLVLDNFEQVTSAAPAIVGLLEACPGLKALVTSREPLRVRGEYVFTVPTLGLPDIDARSGPTDVLRESEAVQLFVERARAVNSRFELTEENLAAVAELCVRLDGLPLAMELAAARLNLFSPRALLDRLAGGTDVLGGGAQDLPERQRTLHDTIDWSYGLLQPSDRLLFRLLSVFYGIGLDATAGTMSELKLARGARVDVIERLASLVDKSLLRREEDVGSAPRFSMLRTIRDYATERLREDPHLTAAAQRAHASYFAGFARRQWTSLGGGRRRTDVVVELAADVENLRAAWRYSVEAGDLGRSHELLDSLWLLYDAMAWHQSTVALATDLLAVLESTPSTPDRARQEVTLLTSLARVYLSIRGYTEEVEETYRRALELAERQGKPSERFTVLRGLASLYTFRNNSLKAAEIGRKLLEVAEAENDHGMRLEAHLVLGTNTAFLDDVAGGLAHLDRAVNLSEPDVGMSRPFRFGPNPG
ncbi:MAG: adenylate/guanylate cyclase domain-containing protein, partial [Actinomycetota bacterium]|nr:adenylate/guanylate cyclase domain-containing protein [Actinomycetota bacterium]